MKRSAKRYKSTLGEKEAFLIRFLAEQQKTSNRKSECN
jgi:hypothetical protein